MRDNRLTNLAHKNSMADVLASYTYTLGAIGNRTKIDESNGISRQYQYDKLYRLTNETVTDPTNAQTYQNDFSYDAVGNRLSKTNAPYNQPAVSNDYTYNAAGQLLTENGITYTYDLNGNLASKTDSTGTISYEYDYESRLIKVTSASGIVAYQYDSDGNRVSATTAAGTIKYLVDTNRGLAQVLAEYSTAGVVAASYVYADDLISMNRGGQTRYYHFDGLGSTRLLTDSTGTVTDTYAYDAFGNQIAHTGTTENQFLFTGQQYDENIGFYYLRARYYQPDTGRFTALDPYQGDPYTPMSLHKYLYAANDPVNKIDPSGQFFGGLADAILTIGLISVITLIAGPIYTFIKGEDHLEFNGTNLIWISSFKIAVRSYPAVSGSRRAQRINAGTWIGTNLRRRDGENPGMTCSGRGWSVDLNELNFQSGRTEMRIHPDGSDNGAVGGTNGCIGVLCEVAEDTYDMIKKYFDRGHTQIKVEVRY